MATKTKRRRATHDVLCVACGETFKAAAHNARTCGQVCRTHDYRMSKRGRALADLGVRFAPDGNSGPTAFIWDMQLTNWPEVERLAAEAGVSAGSFVGQTTAYLIRRQQHTIAAEQLAADQQAARDG